MDQSPTTKFPPPGILLIRTSITNPTLDSVPRHSNFSKILDIVLACVVVTLAMTILATIFFVLYYSDPQQPKFRVNSFSLSNFTFTNRSRAFIICEIHLTARNPNLKLRLNYDRILTSINYQHASLSQTSLSPFLQKTKNETSMVARFAGDGNSVEKWVEDGIIGEIEKKGTVELDLMLVSTINWDWGPFNKSDVLEVFCDGLVVGIPSNGGSGALSGGPKHCHVETST